MTLTNPQSWNRYSYALNRPLNLIDPTGLKDVDLEDPQSGRKKEDEQTERIRIGESKTNLPRIISAESRPLRTRGGEVSVGGQFIVEYKYEINNPAGQNADPDPASYGSVEPVKDGSTLGEQSSPISLIATDVKIKDKGNVLEVTKKDTFEVTKDAHSVINYQVVVRDPLTTATDRLASASSMYNNREVIKYKDESGRERERVGRSRPQSIFVDSKSRR